MPSGFQDALMKKGHLDAAWRQAAVSQSILAIFKMPSMARRAVEGTWTLGSFLPEPGRRRAGAGRAR
jgi:hypothetical protein